jgi:hypothetical protein
MISSFILITGCIPPVSDLSLQVIFIPYSIIHIIPSAMNPVKNLIFLLLLMVSAGISGPVTGQTVQQGRLYTLYPPLNLTGTPIECNIYLTWQRPQNPNGTTPLGLVGYYLYRDGLLRHYFPSGDSLNFYDYDVQPGTYIYSITANYDLTSYGLPGQFGESPQTPPITVLLNCPGPMPFYEPWDLGSFAFQMWTFLPAQGNWTMNTGQGNPAPAAFFNGAPAVQNYEVTMRSMALPGLPWICANMYLEFDYKLTDLAAGGTEKLVVSYFIDNTWFPAIEIKNEGSTGWVHQKIDISQVCGGWFRLGFKAMGSNSANITSWAVDNIKVNPVCMGPVNCTYNQDGNRVHLFWENPPCDSLNTMMSGYNLYRSAGPVFGPFVKLNATLITDDEYIDILPLPLPYQQLKYYITLIQHDPASLAVLCEAACDTLDVDLTLGIEPAGNSGTHLFPNPASDRITVQSDNRIISCDLIDCTGQQILSVPAGKLKTLQIPVFSLPSGIYLVRIKNASGTFIRKVAVLH